MRRGTAVVLAAIMMVFGALPGLARDGTTDRRNADEPAAVDVVDRPTDRLADQVADQPVDRPADRPIDHGSDRVVDERPTDLAPTPERDLRRDREIDRYRCVDFVNDRRCVDDRCVDVVTDRRCIDDRHPHVNIRHLIQRLIHAGEWEKLFRLLHRLGII